MDAPRPRIDAALGTWEGVMSTLTFKLGVIVVATASAMAAAAYAKDQPKGASAPAAARSAPAAPRASAPHFSAPAIRSAPSPHFSARPSFSGGAARSHPTFHGNVAHPSYRSNVARSSSHPVFRGQSSRANNVARSHPEFRGTKSQAFAAHNQLRPDDLRRGRHDTLNAQALQSSHAIHQALNSKSVRSALKSPSALRDPRTRSMITASAAKAGWRHGDRNFDHGWWRHRHGGFGWVGPLFWPFAYYDFYNYALWGYDYDDSFWDYGYGDIYAGLFAPYGYDDLAGYLPEYTGTSRSSRYAARYATASTSASSGQLAQMCGDDSRDIAGLPIDRVQQMLQLTGDQRAALEGLATASANAGQIIKAACPRDIALTAPGRLDAMQGRIEAMIQAVNLVEQPLSRFYASLSDEQKARLNALGQEQARGRNGNAAGTLAQNCGAAQAGVTDWPTSEIDRTVHPTGAQRERLDDLRVAATKAADMLTASCPRENTALTPPARLAAVAKRLDVMSEAVKSVRTALNSLYNSLSDEQKAQFDAIGPQRAARG
jgi:hypothetical protein